MSSDTLDADPNLTNQTNIAIIAIDMYFGNIRWVRVCGHSERNDTFKGMGSFANNMYVLLDTDWEADDYDRAYNIILYEFVQDSGLQRDKVEMGSLYTRSGAIDLQVNYKGVYVYGQIGDRFCR